MADAIPRVANMATISRENSPDGAIRTPVQTLGQGDFLKLLVAQMSQQDPMSPMKDADFIAQMAQFSSLEQAKTMQQDMSSLRAISMLGESVTVKDEENKEEGTLTGTVTQVLMEKGVPKLFVDGRRFLLSDLISIQQASQASTVSGAAGSGISE